MDGPGHYRRAEELAAKASEYLGHGDGQESAAVWAAVAQVHATLALAAASVADSGNAEWAAVTTGRDASGAPA
ncbi:MAG: hypothetical protein JOY82_02025 [Streptosporangiaceae bacterium]|nr:hypothetical protein [Streptosporangiaceae bacterium]MBV9853289.1 hypothetical protein [Streptosporangiaceae bacterium]